MVRPTAGATTIVEDTPHKPHDLFLYLVTMYYTPLGRGPGLLPGEVQGHLVFGEETKKSG